MRGPGCLAAHGYQGIEVGRGIQVLVVSGRCHQKKIALRRRALMVAVHRQDAITQRIYAGFYGLASAVRPLAVKPDYSNSAPAGMDGSVTFSSVDFGPDGFSARNQISQ